MLWTLWIASTRGQPVPGQDYHVPLFVTVTPDFLTVAPIGEQEIATTDTDDLLGLVDGAVGRCSRLSTLVITAQPETPWGRVAETLIGVQDTRLLVAFQGGDVDRGGAGAAPLASAERLPKVRDRAVIAYTSEGLYLDGQAMCQSDPEKALCGDDWRYLRSQLGGRPVALLFSPETPTGLVLHVYRAFRDHDPTFAAMSSSDKLVSFSAIPLEESTTWVSLPCEKPLTGPQ